tara:strand:- start:4740 stop:6731 length:1992 start_codon:yes stop_codon:yes gene_type:complete
MFSKILIANRGEIACRVIKTARRMGIATVAVYSDADANALHVQLADEALYIGAAPARDSYLQADNILQAAADSGAQAVHPGYGFLSENADFARACLARGLTFIGPKGEAIDAMGSKAAAKRIMAEAGVPLVPGYHEDDQAPARLRAAADEMGYPVLLKASAGGGGKGMRQVWSPEEFDEQLEGARREAKASFGNDAMLVEKYLTRPRHVEIQVFCDAYGNGVYLAERDCSIQRRHQKVIEEAPAPGLSEALRSSMGEAALQAAHAIDYLGAGTVEFLLDEDGSFYFMEMNTRLQVEHPVTEMITGLDLVEWQLRVANGEPLPLSQDAVQISGHAIEARIYAEDPDNDFLPATGTLAYLSPPEESRNVRVDTGVRQGDEISMHYDPMIAKLVVWDESRARAVQRLARALADYRVSGTVTNIGFLYNLVTCQPFTDAALDTGFIEKHRAAIWRESTPDIARELPRAALALLLHQLSSSASRAAADPFSPWGAGDAWRLNEPAVYRLSLNYRQQLHNIDLERCGDAFRVKIGEIETRLNGRLDGDTLHIDQDGHRQRGTLAHSGRDFSLYLPDGACHFQAAPPDTGEAGASGAAAGLTAPMNGTIVSLLVSAGDEVDAHAPLLVMEAMKMEHTIRAPFPGHVASFNYAPGDLVDGGAELLEFTAKE